MRSSTPVLDTPDKPGPTKVRTVHPLREPFRPAVRKSSRRDRRGFLGFLKASPLAYTALILLGLIVLGAVFAPLLSPYDKDRIDLARQYLPPSLEHPFGTDDLGRDTLSGEILGRQEFRIVLLRQKVIRDIVHIL